MNVILNQELAELSYWPLSNKITPNVTQLQRIFLKKKTSHMDIFFLGPPPPLKKYIHVGSLFFFKKFVAHVLAHPSPPPYGHHVP